MSRREIDWAKLYQDTYKQLLEHNDVINELRAEIKQLKQKWDGYSECPTCGHKRGGW